MSIKGDYYEILGVQKNASIDEVKKALKTLTQQKDNIRKAYKTIHQFLESNTWLEKARSLKLRKEEMLGEHLLQIEATRLHYLKVFLKLPPETKREIIKNFIVEFAFNTTSIEGNTIKLPEAKALLEEGKTPKDKTLREIYDLQNTEQVFLELMNKKKEINHTLIIAIHDELLQNIDSRKGYRTTDVRVIRSAFEATPAPYVKADMDILLAWYKRNMEKHPLILATIFHHKFEKIHPFMDGNGRTGRMLLNYILLKHSYPPLIIHKKTRNEYLDALQKADSSKLNEIKEEYYTSLIQFTANELTENYWNIFL